MEPACSSSQSFASIVFREKGNVFVRNGSWLWIGFLQRKSAGLSIFSARSSAQFGCFLRFLFQGMIPIE